MSPTPPVPPRGFRGAPRRLLLTQESFGEGPVFIDEPDTCVELTEDVAIDFREVPPPEASPFHLGWFGGIVVRTSRVRIDLGGHTLSMAEAYRAHQRFFALVELCNTPLPSGKGGFVTDASQNDDIVIRNGRLENTSHHCIHAVRAGRRWVMEDLELRGFEVGAISLNEPSDLVVRRCVVGKPIRPLTSTDQVMVRDLIRSATRLDGRGPQTVSQTVARRMRAMARTMAKAPAVSDALIRCIVLMPEFNVGRPDLSLDTHARIERVAIHDITFADIEAAPVEVVGVRGEDGQPIKDVNGNLISHEDTRTASELAHAQAFVTPAMPEHIRNVLLRGVGFVGEPLHGLDRRAHHLVQKASLFLRIDNCRDVRLSGLTCGSVRTSGAHSASCGLMLNGCSRVSAEGITVAGVSITDQCVSALSDMRPQSGLYVRKSKDVRVRRFEYASDDACSCALRDVTSASLRECAFAAPMTALRVKRVRIE